MRFAALLLALVFSTASIAAAPVTPQQQPNPVASQDFKQELTNLTSKLDANLTLAEDAKQQIVGLIKAAQATIEQNKLLSEKLVENVQAAKSAESIATGLKEALGELTKSELKAVDPKTNVSKLEVDVTTLQREVEKSTDLLAAIETKIARRNDEIQKLGDSATLLDERLANTKKAIQSLPADDGSLLLDAKRIELLTQEASIELEMDNVTAEQKRYESEDAVNLLRYQRDLEEARLERSQKQLDALQVVLNEKRKKKASEQAVKAATKQAETIKRFPFLANSLEFNTELAKKVITIEEEAKKAIADRDALIERLKDLTSTKRETVDRVDAIGLSASVGAMLRRRRVELAKQASLSMNTEEVTDQLQEAQFEDFEWEEMRKALDREVIIDEIGPDQWQQVSVEEKKTAEGQIDELITSRHEKLMALDEAINRKFRALMQVIEYDSKIKKTSSAFREYINERILWIRSNDVLFSQIEIDQSDRSLLKPNSWYDAADKIWTVIQRRPLATCLSTLVIVLLLLFKSRMRNEVDRLGVEAAKGSCVTFWPTSKALFLSVIIGITVPLMPLMLGVGMYGYTPSDSPLFDALGKGLLTTAWFALPMEILRRMCRPKGLAYMHFDWPNKAVETLKSNLDWMIFPSALLIFAIALLHNLDVAHRVDLIERSLFVVSLALLGFFLYRIFNSNDGIFSEYLAANEKTWVTQTSVLWVGFILLVPLSLAFLTVWGYYYTALNLAGYLYATFVFALIVETVRALLRRLIMLSRRRVHIQAARRKRELQIEAQKEAIKAKEEAERALAAAEAEARTSGSEVDPSTLPAPATTPIPSVESLIELRPSDDIDDNAIRATKLIGLIMIVVWSFGLWMIWADVLPALKALDNVPLWPANNVTQTVAVASSDAPKAETTMTPMGPSVDISASTETNSQVVEQKFVTVRDLLMFIVIALLTLVSARNLPAATEMLFLDHLPVDRSFRYATKSLTSYAIIMLGMVLAFRTLSISWDNVQWLATALTFGLAFGLQEIFANFVAGIILMFERPIRIGDWITVDEFTGVVTKIRTRATTIVNWDRKEYVIPNKDFITGRLINWTLSDAVNRVVINVGVAYGSDVIKAKQILLEVCTNHPKTIAEPRTTVAFEEFADSSLSLVARTFLGEVESRVTVIDDLHTQINQAFIDAGIEISFPQQDLHIRSVDPTAAEVLAKQ